MDRENHTVRLVINSKDESDFIDVLNLFFGIPEEDGMRDINDNDFVNFINKLSETNETFSIADICKKKFGVDLEDFIAELYFDADSSFEDGLSVNAKLSNGKGAEYFVTGISVRFVDAETSNTALEDAKISGAQNFDAFPITIVLLIQQMIVA